MQFLLVGISIAQAPVEVLERVSVSTLGLGEQLARLNTHAGGGVIISTCNRTEIYGMHEHPETGVRQLVEFLQLLVERGGQPPPDISSSIYSLTGDDVARHLFRVTAGLDSIALGEAQVAGQVTRALRAAGEATAVEAPLSRLFHAALRTSRSIRHTTGLGRDRISISSIGVQLIERHVGDLSGKSALLVGAGETGRMTANALRSSGVGELLVSSRSMERAEKLARELNGEAIPFAEMPATIERADVLITCTGATEPVVLAGAVKTAMSKRSDRPLVVMDAGMPRDVDPAAADVEGVSLFGLQQLQAIADEHRERRQAAASLAEELIERGVERFKERLVGIEVEPVIRVLGARAETMRVQEIERAASRMKDLTDEQMEILDAMSRSLVKRILADPITFLRTSESTVATDAVQRVFDLYGEDEDEL